MASYTSRYTKGMTASYGQTLADALAQARQQEALTGRPMTQAEYSAIVSGALAPYVGQYSQGLFRAGQLEEEQRRTDIAEEAQKRSEQAAKMQGYLNIGTLGIGGLTAAAMAKQAGLFSGFGKTLGAGTAAEGWKGVPYALPAGAELPAGEAWKGVPYALPETATGVPAGAYALPVLAGLGLGAQIPGVRNLYPESVRGPLAQVGKLAMPIATLHSLAFHPASTIHKIGGAVSNLKKAFGF